MSEEPTTPDLTVLAQHLADAVNAKDLDAAMSYYAPNAVYDTTPQGLGVYQGRAAIRDFLEEVWAMAEDSEFEFEENRDLGNGVAFAICVVRARPLGSAARGEGRYAAVGIWRDGLVERTTHYSDIDEGRAAAEHLAQERR